MKCLAIFAVLLASIAALPLEELPVRTPAIHSETHSMGARITGGDVAAKGQFPYQAGLKIDLGGQATFCGGTLISKRHILTAAHCCEGAEQIDVILGSTEIYNETEPSRISMTVSMKDVRIHAKWNSDLIVNDICMIKLQSDIELSEYIKIVDLPMNDSQDYQDKIVVASGWGRDSDHSHAISSVLKFVKSKIIKNQVCNAFYFGLVQETNVCTSGAGGLSTCSGDSGGPLVLEATDVNNTTLVGITSYGISFGCEIGWPPVFTRVNKYLKWIRANMN